MNDHDDPVTVRPATPEIGYRIPPPPPGFVPRPARGFVITGRFAGDMAPAPAAGVALDDLCDFCLDGTPHPHIPRGVSS